MPVQLPVHFLQVAVEGPKFRIFRFGLSFSNIPIFYGNGMFHGKLASRSVYRDPGINREFVVVAGSAGPQDEMNTKGVVLFHTISFLRYQSLFA